MSRITITNVDWDTSLRDVEFMSSIASVPVALQGKVRAAVKITTGAPAATPGWFIPGAMIINAVDATWYRNSGTTASPVWSLVS